MIRYQNVVVGVALDGRDGAVVRYAEHIAALAGAEAAALVHVLPSPASLGDLYPHYRRSFETARAEASERLERIAEAWGRPRTAVDTVLPEGTPLVEILHLAADGAADLVVVGADQDGATTAEKLARKAPCSVLIVPPGSPARVSRVLVPVDFSDHAADAVDVAVAFVEAAGLAEVHLLHVYPVPTGYLDLGLDPREIAALIRGHAEDRFERFVAGLDLRGLAAERHLAEGDDVPATVLREAAALGADLVAVGTRGRSDTAAVLLGSVAEQVVRGARVPTVAVKRKGATLPLLDALFQL